MAGEQATLITPVPMLKAVTAAGAGSAVPGRAGPVTFQAWGLVSAGAGSAAVEVQGSHNDGVTWDTIATISLTLGTSPISDSFTADARYQQLRGNVTAITGTNAAVSLTAGY